MVSSKDTAIGIEPQSLLGIDVGDLKLRGALSTAEEIAQQPAVWREVLAQVRLNRASIDSWLDDRLSLPRVQVLFCGAGTSAFIGDTLAPWLRKDFESTNPISFESVSTTSLVASPQQYLGDDRPTLMVSFARSGDSPESVAAVELADSMLSDCSHLIITCNPNGKLADYAERSTKSLILHLPERTNDRGFAMTSSYTSMLVACASVFGREAAAMEAVCSMADNVISERVPDIARVAQGEFDRLVVLGAGALEGTAQEFALKCIELAAGKLVGISNTPLGLRHGPKIVITSETVVVLLVSNDPYTQQYDRDLLDELRSEGKAGSIIELSSKSLFPDYYETIEDAWMSLVYIVYGQIFAFLKAYSLGVTVDSPCPSGEVNRVVQGVTIHPFS